MPEVHTSVIVVSWNVREQLRTCLANLERARGELSLVGVIVVDNASLDGSAAMVAQDFPWVQLVALPKNVGFATACNLGAAKAVGTYLLFLNPDTAVAPNIFQELAQAFATHPKAAVIGGSIKDERGMQQASVRALPTIWSSTLDALKLLRRLPALSPGYLRPDFDYGKSQLVPQVMGACFAVRREAWQRLAGFDEQFFVWFEEVDFCKRASAAGYEVWYVPSLQLRHQGGASFTQVPPIQRHRLFTHSLVAYTRKHDGYLAAAGVRLAAVLGYAPALLAAVRFNFARAGYAGRFFFAMACFFTLELASWYGWHQQWLANVLTVALGVGWLALARRHLGLAAVLLVTELMVGSQGYLLKFVAGGSELSLRLVLFMLAFAFMVYRVVSSRQLAVQQHAMRLSYGVALVAIAWGTVVGILRGNAIANLVLDMNAYLYLLLFPLFVEAVADKRLHQWLRLLVPAGLVWLALKTVAALYLFSHVPVEALAPFYHWWRQTGFGEITYVSGNMFRIFSQSQVFAAVVTAACLAMLTRLRGTAWAIKLTLFVSLVVLLASLSRSFWLGTTVAVVTALGVYAVTRPGARAYLKYLLTASLLVVAAAGTVLATTRLNWPLPPLGDSQAAVFAQRLQGEAASASRLKLLGPLWDRIDDALVLGSGFGTTVTYYSLDPRLVRGTAGGTGLTETYAFEWGYLDLLLKLGLIGSAAFVAFVIHALYAAWQNAWWLGTGLLALLVLNITTPYLNHPLGLGLVMALAAWGPVLRDIEPSPA